MSGSRGTISSSLSDSTTCGALLCQLQIRRYGLKERRVTVILDYDKNKIWDEIGESDSERDKMLLQLEQECLNVYRRKVESTKKYKADLHEALIEAKAEAANIASALGEKASFLRLDKVKGTLKDQMSSIKPVLEDLQQKREERIKEFWDIQSQIVQLRTEIVGNVQQNNTTETQIDDGDLTVKKLGELKFQLQELQREKSVRLQKINNHIKVIHELSDVLSADFVTMMNEIHPSLCSSSYNHSKSITNVTISRLVGLINSLKQEKEYRLRKLQDLGSTLIELWNLLDTPIDERKRFDHVTSLISAAFDEVLKKETLASDIIEQTELEIERLNIFKASKMKELILDKQKELEEIYNGIHVDMDDQTTQEILIRSLDSGDVDMSDLLSNMDNQIVKAKELASSRKEILDKVEKWRMASEEEHWLDDYEKDQNRYTAGRGAHKNLKRAEKARILVSKIPSLVESLTMKVKAWEEEKGIPFLYDKMPLFGSLQEYTLLRLEREEEKRRSREKKRLQEQLATEKETLFGSKPSPMRLQMLKKPLGQSNNSNTMGGTPIGKKAITPLSQHANLSEKGHKVSGKTSAVPVAPVNYVAFAKDDCVGQGGSAVVSP